MKVKRAFAGLATIAVASALTLFPAMSGQAAETLQSTESIVLNEGGGLTFSSGDAAELTPTQSAELAQLDRSLPAIEAATVGGVFNYTAAIALGVDTRVATEWAQGVIRAGGQVLGLPAEARADIPQREARASCRGVNKMWSDWLGWHAKLSSCNTKKVIDAMRAGAAATTVASIIITAAGGPVGAVSAIVPAMLTWSAASVEACSRNGTGVEVAFSGFICWAQ